MSDMHRVRPGIITFPEYLDRLIIADIAQKHNSFRLPPLYPPPAQTETRKWYLWEYVVEEEKK